MEKKLGPTDAIIALLLPGIGFLGAYCYEIGFANYYSIPIELISVDGRNVAICVVVALTLLAVLNGIDIVIKAILSKSLLKFGIESQKRLQLIWYDFFSILLFLNLFLLFFNVPIEALIFGWVYQGLTILGIVLGHIRRNKVSKTINENSGVIDTTVLENTFLMRVFGVTSWKIVGGIYLLCYLCLSVGFILARSKNDFYQVNDRKDVAGIVIYGDKMIVSKLSGSKISSSLEVVDIRDGTKFERKILPNF